jgi:manganese/zinc/iron transport system ATP- binding protein
MTTNEVIKIHNLTVSYRGKPALNRFEAQLEQGKVTALVGHNGSGKSTLLKALAGIVDYHGQIDFFGQNSRGGLQIGYMPQRFEIDFSLPLTVGELLSLSLVTCRHSQKEKAEFQSQSLSKVGLQGFAKRTLNSLSGGQLQRVLLARAIVHQPQLLLLDEPEAGMDAKSEQSFYQLLRQLTEKETYTVVLASHNLENVAKFADRIIDLHN